MRRAGAAGARGGAAGAGARGGAAGVGPRGRGRRELLGSAAWVALALAAPPGGRQAARAAEEAAQDVEPFSPESLSKTDGWAAAGGGGVRYRVLRKGAGDRDAGIFDPPDKFKTFPFVAVRFSAYSEDGRRFFGTEDLRKADFSYQVGVRQGLEDEFGGVNQMVVGERRQFVVPEDVVLENISGGKLFGRKVPSGTAVLVDVELLSLRPY